MFFQHCLSDEPMAKHVSFKTGGCADFFISPTTTEELVKAIQLCNEKNIPYFMMGNGTNLLVADSGFRGAVIQLCTNMSGETVENCKITAKCGTKLSTLANLACERGLTGLEFAAGIPGTVGGGVAMNAGAYDGEMSQVVESVTVLDDHLQLVKLTNPQMEFAYRHSVVQHKKWIILEVIFKLAAADKQAIKDKMQSFQSKRKEKQPLEFPSAGSTFKRPEGHYAAKLIEDCGLKGFSVGGAQVSDKHAGFIINVNAATTCDIIAVMDHCKQIVFQQTGVMLTPEVKLLQ